MPTPSNEKKKKKSKMEKNYAYFLRADLFIILSVF